MDKPCPNCRMPVPGSATHCQNCGQHFGTGTQPIGSTGVPSSRRSPAATPAVIPSGHQRVCPNCGWVAPSRLEQCPHCDTHYGAVALLIDALPDQLYWVGVKTSFTCRACGHISPLNHLDLDGSIACLHCGIEQRFDTNQWWGALAHAHAVGDLAGPHPEGRFPNEFVPIWRANPFTAVGLTVASATHEQPETKGARAHQHALRLEATPGHPLCELCRAALDLVHHAAGELHVKCRNPSCGNEATYVMPSSIGAKAPYLVGVVGREHLKGQRNVHLQSDASLVVAIRCPHCSAPLDVASHSTRVTCSYCHQTSRVTDKALRYLGFERPKTETWWLLLKGPSKLRSKLERLERKANAKPPVARPFTPLRPSSPATKARPKQPPRNLLRATLYSLLVSVSAALVYFLTLTQSSPEHAEPLVAPLSPTVVAERPLSGTENNPQQPKPRTPTPTEPEPPRPSFVTSWNAKVKSARGKPLAAGHPCDVSAKIVAGALDWVQVSCKNTAIYDKRTPLSGMSMSGWELFEAPTKDGLGWQYHLLYSDVGARQGRSQATLNTSGQQGVVFDETTTPFRVELTIDATSLPRSGSPLYDTPQKNLPLQLRLKVGSADGPAPLRPGTDCELSVAFVMSSSSGHRCKAQLTCKKQTHYGRGQSGHGSCQLNTEGNIIAFNDNEPTFGDGDPSFELNRQTRSITLRDTPKDQEYRVGFESRLW